MVVFKKFKGRNIFLINYENSIYYKNEEKSKKIVVIIAIKTKIKVFKKKNQKSDYKKYYKKFITSLYNEIDLTKIMSS